MKKIKDFKDETSCYKYMVKNNITINKTGRDEEVEGYLSKDGTSVYKILFSPNSDYNAGKMITTSDLDIELFRILFPEEIYTKNNHRVLAYKNQYVDGVPLYKNNLINNVYLNSVEQDVLKKSINTLIREINELSARDIVVSNLKENLIVNKNGLYIADTRGYKKNASYKENTPLEYIKISLYGDTTELNNKESFFLEELKEQLDKMESSYSLKSNNKLKKKVRALKK